MNNQYETIKEIVERFEEAYVIMQDTKRQYEVLDLKYSNAKNRVEEIQKQLICKVGDRMPEKYVKTETNNIFKITKENVTLIKLED